MRAHFTGVRASGMALTGFARVPGFLLSFATTVILMLTPRVHHLDARAEPFLGALTPGQLSGSMQVALFKATESHTTTADYGTGAPSGPDELPYQATFRVMGKLDAQSNTKVMCALLQWVAKKRGTRGGAWRPTWIHLAVLQPLI